MLRFFLTLAVALDPAKRGGRQLAGRAVSVPNTDAGMRAADGAWFGVKLLRAKTRQKAPWRSRIAVINFVK
jgi:hypothetical protein